MSFNPYPYEYHMVLGAYGIGYQMQQKDQPLLHFTTQIRNAKLFFIISFKVCTYLKEARS